MQLNKLDDMPTRFFHANAKTDVTFDAQSSIIINGKRSFSVSWSFSITSKTSGTFSAPRILKTTTNFHNAAIEKLKYPIK